MNNFCKYNAHAFAKGTRTKHKMAKKISVIIHTYNNEKIIRDCLDSVKDFDEIVICDMYSTDKTLEIAKEYGCKIVMHENLGWADPARNFAISQAENDWVLVVDSDEQITPELREYLYKFLDAPKDYAGVWIPRLNYCWGKPMELLYPDFIFRFFRKDKTYIPPKVHYRVEVSDRREFYMPTKDKKLAIIHNHTQSIGSIINKLNKYTDLECEKLIETNKKINFGYAMWKSIWLTIEKFILKGGYKDGIRGFYQSYIFGMYKFFTYVKYWEYKNAEDTKCVRK